MKTYIALMGLLFTLLSNAQQVLVRPVGGSDVLLPTNALMVGNDTTIVCGVATLGSNPNTAFVSKVGPTSVIWSFVFGFNTRFDAMTLTQDGDIVAVGSSLGDIFVARMSMTGDTLWTRGFASSSTEFAKDVVERSNGNLVIVGARGSNSSSREILLEVSPSGFIVSQYQQASTSGSHSSERAIVCGDSTITFGTSRFGSFSTKDVSVRVVYAGGELMSKNFGTSSAEGPPRVSKHNNNYWVVTENAPGIGVVCLDSQLGKVDSLSFKLVLSGNTLYAPELLVYGGYIYLGGRAQIGTESYAFVSKVNLNTLSVSWTKVLGSSGSVSAQPRISQGKLVVVSSQGPNIQMSQLDTLMGDMVYQCESGLPTFGLELVPYGLTESVFSTNQWSDPGLSSSGTTSFDSYSTVFDNCFGTTLPVELLSFTAEVVSTYDVVLRWQTATEYNNSYFAIERSSDGLSFEEVARVEGAGSSQTTFSYEYFDDQAPSGISYYRLRQTDFDGSSTISQAVSVTVGLTVEVPYPNPISSGQTLSGVFGPYKIFDSRGVLVKEGTSNGNVYIQLSGGIYVVSYGDNKTFRLKVNN